MPREFTCFENEYRTDLKIEDLKAYDQVVTTYYDLRDENRRIDSFTKQISGAKLDEHETDRDQLKDVIKKQGFCQDWQ